MLHDRRGRSPVIAHELIGRRRILNVVEAELLALYLDCAAEAAGVWSEPVKRRLLVLVLAVLQRMGERPENEISGGNPSVSEERRYAAIHESYAEVCAKASAARRRRIGWSTVPSLRAPSTSE